MEYLKKLNFFYAKNRIIDVNCWFCNENSKIEERHLTWWYCYNCEQYNGFDKHGDYNQKIRSMSKQSQHAQQFCQTAKVEAASHRSFLCASCESKQNKKIHEMAMFEPSSEERFDEECTQYESYLNEKYKLCLACQLLVDRYLQKQDEQLKEKYQHETASNFHTRNLNKTNFAVVERDESFNLLVFKFFLHVISCVGSFWFLQNDYISPAIAELKMAILLPTFCVLQILLCITRLSKRFNRNILILLLLWVLVLVSKLSPRQRQSRLVLGVLFAFNICSLIYPIINIVSRVKQNYQHSKEQTRRIEMLRSVSQKRNLNRSNNESLTRTLSNIKQLDNEDFSINNQPVNSSLETPLRNGHQTNFEKEINVNETEHRLSSETPDLLEGHMDAMFIAKTKEKAELMKAGDVKNHVIAALKYETPICYSPGGSILKPATLTLNREKFINENLTNTYSNVKNKMKVAQYNNTSMDEMSVLSINQQRQPEVYDDRRTTDKSNNFIVNTFISHPFVMLGVLLFSIVLNLLLFLT